MNQEEKRYSIGQMAKLCNVTTKQLRHYDENNILSPCYKDDDTNYRYYSERQLEEILLIKDLKRIGLSLKSIANLLHNRNLLSLKKELESSIFQAQEELHAAQQKYDQAIDVFLRVLNALDQVAWGEQQQVVPPNPSFEIINVPLRQVVFTRYRSYWNAKSSFIARRAELYKIIDEYKLVTSGPNMAIFHGQRDYLKQFSDRVEDSNGDLEVCMNVSEHKERCPHCRNMGGFRAVSTIHVGHYRHMEPTYLALEQWAQQQGLELSGDSLEEYIAGATMTNREENYVTRIYLPLKNSRI